MLKITLAALAIAGLATAASAQGQVNCSQQYKDFWEKLMRENSAKLSGEQLAAFHRAALRGYDSCTAGDEQFATKFFEKLALEHGGAKK